MAHRVSRRRFLENSALSLGSSAIASTGLADWALAGEAGTKSTGRSLNEQPVFGFVGTGIRFQNARGLGYAATQLGPGAAVCDVDAVQLGRGMQIVVDQARKHNRPINVAAYEDYRRILDRQDIDAVVIATTDHWHTKIAIEAMQAGKDVYCEKPMTLTIHEGRQILNTIQHTGRVLQVGTQQRTAYERRFAIAAAMIRDNRIGRPTQLTCAIGEQDPAQPLPVVTPPKHLNWEMWIGQAPMVDYRQGPLIHTHGWGAGFPLSRAHRYFRWWYEYSGGRITDWGTHHVDCALWAVGRDNGDTGPLRIEPLQVKHPVPFDADGMPTVSDRFNTAMTFHARVTYPDGLLLDVRNTADDLGFDNGILFQGDQGRLFVNRGKLTGRPVELLKENPLPENALDKLYGRRVSQDHMEDFVECIKSRNRPASDAESHHHTISVCHAINVAFRLGRTVIYDPATEQFVGDAQANRFVRRKQRAGYEIRA